jgi:hypothetical protein
VAVFRERSYPRPYYEPAPIAREQDGYDRRRDQAARSEKAAPTAPAARGAREASSADAYGGVGQGIGTGHGAREWSPVNRTEFVRASRTPAQVVQLRYDDIPNLVAMGVMPRPYEWDRRHRRPSGPQAFPGGFAADPPGRW